MHKACYSTPAKVMMMMNVSVRCQGPVKPGLIHPTAITLPRELITCTCTLLTTSSQSTIKHSPQPQFDVKPPTGTDHMPLSPDLLIHRGFKDVKYTHLWNTNLCVIVLLLVGLLHNSLLPVIRCCSELPVCFSELAWLYLHLKERETSANHLWRLGIDISIQDVLTCIQPRTEYLHWTCTRSH